MIKILTIILVLSFSSAIYAECLDPASEKDSELIDKLHKNITIKIYRSFLAEGKADSSNLNKEELWYEASDQAEEIVNDNFICKDLAELIEI